MPPAQRNALGAVTILIVFTMVALTTWRPAQFVVPALVVIAGLAGLDQSIVTSSGRTRPGTPVDPAAGRPVGGVRGKDATDAATSTLALPRLRSVDPRAAVPSRHQAPAGEDVLSWSTLDNAGLDDPLAVHTMAIDMRALLEDGPAWVR